MMWLKRFLAGLREARAPYYTTSLVTRPDSVPPAKNGIPLELDAADEYARERPDPSADAYRQYFEVGADELFLLKDYSVDEYSEPGQRLEYFDFIHRLADGTFVARYQVVCAGLPERSAYNYRLYRKYDGNNRKLLQADLP
ncbi:MAG: hypothetical protein GYB58_12615 [Gammaproteobacteria bacterium]|nr:hypothetical protein [Gammaproteobacteria bacterium]